MNYVKTIYVLVASPNKGQTWTICYAPLQLGILGAEDKKTAQAILEKEYEKYKHTKYRIAKKYFKIVEFEMKDNSKANVNFSQGLDARFITAEIAELLKQVKKKRVHFAFDYMKNEQAILKGLEIYKNIVGGEDIRRIVYILTNFNTTIEQDLYRVHKVQELGYLPDIRVYRKNTAPQVTKDLQRWCNNRIIYRSCDFMDYIPRKDGKTIKQIYFN